MASEVVNENVPPMESEADVKAPSPKKFKVDNTQVEEHVQAGGDTVAVGDVNKGLVLRFAKLSDNATIPTYGSAKAAGVDLYSACDCIVPPKGKFCVPTDIQVAIPDGCYGRVAPRSGLAVKNFIDVGAGVVDSDYRGNIQVLLFNHGDEEFQVKKGDRIAQLICEMFARCNIVESELDATDRGHGGFGSTGV